MNKIIKLLDEYQNGEKSNFILIANEIEDKIQYLKRCTDEDIFQEIFIILPKKLRKIKIETIKDYDIKHTQNYLGKVMDNIVKDIRRKQINYYKRNYFMGDEPFSNESSFKINIFEKIELSDLLENVLDEREKYIIEKRYFDDISIKKISESIDITRERTNVIKNNALKKLKEEYKKNKLLN